ncbi:general odorant-binding protein 56d-like [Nomia melanderi]|uniref:general odorant-binding protein 56d-like n=1 Tax=Nomia melanderi TaxID=2448451 RepID=UPI001304386B|nr:general odorant-binding protein 56d-like [Nomia melanderi]
MKAILLVAALCFVSALALTDEQRAKLSEYKKSCVAESGVDIKTVEDAKAGNIPESDEKLACFASCMLKKIGIMNQDGSINEEVARQKVATTVPQDQAEELIGKCKDTTGANDCDKAFKLVKCLKTNKSFAVLN